MISYASGSPDITNEMLQSYGMICDEIYTITWRESKYTLIRASKGNKPRLSALKKVIDKLEMIHGLKSSAIIGYESLTCNSHGESSIHDHPGFKRMTQQLNKNPDELSTWLATGEITTNKKGLLWKYIETTDPSAKTHGQLVSQILAWTPVVREADTLRAENEVLKITLGIREKEIQEEEARNTRLYNQLVEKINECTALRINAIQNPQEP